MVALAPRGAPCWGSEFAISWPWATADEDDIVEGCAGCWTWVWVFDREGEESGASIFLTREVATVFVFLPSSWVKTHTWFLCATQIHENFVYRTNTGGTN